MLIPNISRNFYVHINVLYECLQKVAIYSCFITRMKTQECFLGFSVKYSSAMPINYKPYSFVLMQWILKLLEKWVISIKYILQEIFSLYVVQNTDCMLHLKSYWQQIGALYHYITLLSNNGFSHTFYRWSNSPWIPKFELVFCIFECCKEFSTSNKLFLCVKPNQF